MQSTCLRQTSPATAVMIWSAEKGNARALAVPEPRAFHVRVTTHPGESQDSTIDESPVLPSAHQRWAIDRSPIDDARPLVRWFLHSSLLVLSQRVLVPIRPAPCCCQGDQHLRFHGREPRRDRARSRGSRPRPGEARGPAPRLRQRAARLHLAPAAKPVPAAVDIHPAAIRPRTDPQPWRIELEQLRGGSCDQPQNGVQIVSTNGSPLDPPAAATGVDEPQMLPGMAQETVEVLQRVGRWMRCCDRREEPLEHPARPPRVLVGGTGRLSGRLRAIASSRATAGRLITPELPAHSTSRA